MLVSIKRWLEPPSIEGDEEKTIQTRIANTLMLYLGAALLIIIFILIPLFAFQKIGSWILSIIMFCGIAAGRYFLFKGNYRLATVIVFSIIYLCILAMLILSGGNSGTAMFYFATVVLVAGFFLETGVVNGFTIATFLIAVGVSFLQNRGLVSLPIIFKFNSAFSWVATGVGLLFMIRTRDLFVGNLKNALRLAHQQNLTRQQMEARFRAVVEYSGNGVVFMNAERKINYVSPAYQQFLGFTPEEMTGHFGPEYIHPEDREFTGRKFAELLQTPAATVIIEYRLQRKDGSYCWVETTATNLLDNPDVQAVVLNQRDINERKLIETHNRIIAEVQEFLLHPCELEEIYGLVPEKVKQMIGDGITASAILDEKQKTIRMGSYHGVDIPFEKILSVIGFDPWQKEFPLDAITDKALNMYYYSKLVIVEDGLYSLLTRIVPKPACLLIEKLLRVQKIYGMGFVHKNEHMGGLVILARSDITPHIAAIEQIVNLATIAIERKRAEIALNQSEAKYRRMVETANEGVMVLDRDSRMTGVNKQAASMLGYSIEELIGQKFELLLFTEDLEDHLTQMQMRKQGQSSVFERCFRRKDGSKLWTIISATTITDHEGNFNGSFGMLTDITERKRSEDQLRKSEAMFRAVVENSNDGILFGDANAVIHYRSPSYNRINGYSDQERVGHSGFETVHPDDAKDLRAYWANLIAHPEISHKTEYRIRHKDGTWRWIESSGQNLLNNPDVQSVIINSRDITERKHSEDALKQSELKYRGLFEVNKDGISIFLVDAQGVPSTFIEFNTAAHQMLGYTRDEMLGLSPQMLEPKTTLEQLQFRESEFKTKGIANFETALLHKDGHLVSTDFTAQLIQYEGKPAVMNIVRDITEREQYENELQAIATLSAALRAAQTRAEMLPVIVEQLIFLLNCEAVTIEIIDPLTGDSVTEAAFGIWKPLIGVRQEKGTGINAIISQTRQPWHTNDLNHTENFAHPEFVHKGIHGGIGAPLIAQDNLIGFVWMGRQNEVANSDVRLLSSIADITANAIYRATLHEQAQKDAADLTLAYDTTLEGWVQALELRDHETEGHTRRVVEMTIDLARSMGVSEDEVIEIRRGALLHDIGKMGIPDSVLLKPGTLNEREWEIMRQHPDYAYRLLTPIEYLRPVLDIPYCHHERWDGTGYPRGLKNEEIPLAARIFAIVDVWDALTSDRPYRLAWSKEKALKHISEQSNKHFDPAVVEAFLKIV
ncbi:PAS domain S-box protein [Candidatus Villigracilis saccharophilus]|uniref:PAS domain S-box protein n=1 Tax=Candidatus Villigracilis saccharophilus TaxID=3140684 RepID=UPI003136AF0F|nr:PAS domain S-box protein [Anaerolineales bacterium]